MQYNVTYNHIIDKNLFICQPSQGFRFGIDSILLAYFATVKKHDNVLDIGAGSGVISALLASKRGCKQITSVEIQQEMYYCLTETVRINNLSDIIKTVNFDIKEFDSFNKFSLIVCNPPYRHQGTGRMCKDGLENKARFTLELTVNDVGRVCRRLIKHGGRLALCGDADMLGENLCILKEYGFEPKRLRFFYGDIRKNAKLYFLETLYKGGVQLNVEPPVVQGNDEYINILNGVFE